jgi:hypothetical protein
MKRCFAFALLGGWWLATAGALAAADAVNTVEAKFQLYHTRITLPEFPPTEAYTLEMEDNELTFIPPHDARVAIDLKKREVKFNFRDDRCFILMRHSDVNPGLVTPDSWDKLREVLQARYPESKVSEGSVCLNSCGTRGCSFIVNHRPGYMGIKLVTRIGFIPVEGGAMEISMTANGDKFQSQQFAFHTFLNCLSLEKQNLEKLRAVK